MSSGPPSRSIVDCLRTAVQRHPDRIAFRYLTDGDAACEAIDYAALWRCAVATARTLAQIGRRGDRVVLLSPAGLDTAIGLYACFLAGRVAVPVRAPHPRRILVQSDQLLSVVRDCRPVAILTTAAFLDEGEAFAAVGWELAALAWLSILPPAGDAAQDAPFDDPSEADIALLQYTSGSTATPRGVILSHANVMANQHVIAAIGEPGAEHLYCTWLPHYHDMGLAFLLQPVFHGATTILMSPQHFMQKPARWARAVARHACSFTAAPNFALDMLADGVADAELDALDLACLRVLVVGAEPVRAATLEKFVRRFGPCGLSRSALYPCYGLAESTLLVTHGQPGAGPAVEAGSDPDDDGDDGLLVGNGAPGPEHAVAIVDPVTRRTVAAPAIGEVWVSGLSVGQGYWGKAAESEATFRAAVAPSDGKTYLRTGDLGFVRGGQLFVAGRIKELIIVRGRNLYPADLEELAGRAHARIFASAAFAVPQGRGDVGLVLELRRGPPGEVRDIEALVRRRVADHFELDAVVLALAQYRLPRTTSGKIKRNLCRQQFEAGAFASEGVP